MGDGGSPQDAFRSKKYLWGNMPSIDVVRLEDNEGASYEQNLRILFAGMKPWCLHLVVWPLMSCIASGDLRNVVKTVARLPQSYTGKPSIVVNDIDFDIVARNVLMLLLTLMIIDPVEAAETVVHFWYSALIRLIDFLRIQLLRPVIEGVCNKIADRRAGFLQSKTFTFGACSVRIVLTKEGWTALLAFLCVPAGLTTQRAHNIRIAVTMAPHRVDFRHRELMLQQPEHRICKERFREDGILVPFGYSRKEFTIPNPYVVQTDHALNRTPLM
jgi:hypothetical protein